MENKLTGEELELLGRYNFSLTDNIHIIMTKKELQKNLHLVTSIIQKASVYFNKKNRFDLSVRG